MDTLLDTNPLLSWNMFQEKSGRIMLKVRFGQNEGEEEPNTNVHFRRKSESQIKRDNSRAYHHNTRQAAARNKSSAESAEFVGENGHSGIDMLSNSDLVNQSPHALLSPVCELGAYGFMDQSTCPELSVESPPELITRVDTSLQDDSVSEMPDTADFVAEDNQLEQGQFRVTSEHELNMSEISCPDVKHKSKDKKKTKRIHCAECNTIARPNGYIKLSKCDKCKRHVCEFDQSTHLINCKKRNRTLNS